MEEGMCSIDLENVRKSLLTKQKYWMSMLIFSKDWELPRRTLQIQIKRKVCACKTCTQKCSCPSSRWLSSKINDLVKEEVLEKVEHSTELCWTLVNSFVHSRERCFRGQWKFPCSTWSNQEEAMPLFRSKRSQGSTGMWALLFQICGWPNRKIPWM